MNLAGPFSLCLAVVSLSVMLMPHAGPVTLPAAERLALGALVAKHLESIGDAQARESWKSCRATGSGTFLALSGADAQNRKLQGPSFLTSEGRQSRYPMEFRAADYPAESASFDGREV